MARLTFPFADPGKVAMHRNTATDTKRNDRHLRAEGKTSSMLDLSVASEHRCRGNR
jgi:hypothetical protein